jgi:GTP pyrophosphokinase
MDEIAERGFAAHWKYKGIRNQNNFYDTWLDGIRDILENSQGDPVEFLNDFKTNLFQEEVYVYTPAGDLKILPKGATALDFAFLIHSDVGYHCSAVKVNNKLVPMGYKLNNGDKINVVTNKNQKPNEDWLKLVVTGKARSKIRSAIKEERKEKGSYGKEALQRKLRNMKLNYEINVDIVSHFFGFESRNDLYYAIATEQVSLSNLRKLDIEQGKFKLPKVQPDPEPIKDNKKEIKGEVKLLINGEPGDQYNPELATCCNPVMGDGIFAYVTSKNSIRIHRTSCPNATHMMANYGYRVMKAEWVHTYGTQFVAELIVSGIDEGPGVLEKITNLLGTMLGINIRSFNVSADAGYFEARLSILVMNRDQLNMVMRALKNLVGINNVLRVE